MNENIKETLDQILFHIKRINDEVARDYSIVNNKYLLGQMLRQIYLPKSNYYISEAAEKLWNQITDENIMNYWYNDQVLVKFNDIELDIFKGASKESESKLLKKGSKFSYRSVFHDDHIVPIENIIKQLIELNPLTYDWVYDIIKNISVCRMLKIEDRTLARTKGRDNLDQVIKEVYKDIKVKTINIWK